MSLIQDRSPTIPPVGRSRSVSRQALLECGMPSSLLYVATDLLGGLVYPGYSFFSQAISELGAIGAPSAHITETLFFMYNVLVLGFAIAVYREAFAGSRALRVTGGLLLVYGMLGFVTAATGFWSTYFKMAQRGVGSVGAAAPHIFLTGLLVLLLALMMISGAFVFGKRFRIYSFATLAVFLLFGALTVPYAARLSAHLPTPGFGIVERVAIYSALLWIAVFAMALLRKPLPGSARR